MPEEKQRETVGELEKQLLAELKSLLKEDKFRRLREIEVQSQGTRSLLRQALPRLWTLRSQSQDVQNVILETDKLARKLLENPKERSSIEKELNSLVRQSSGA